MDIITDLTSIYYRMAVDIYHVNPSIFVFLMVFSIPFYYYGWYGLIREGVDFRDRYKVKKNHLSVSDILTERKFIVPLTINRLAWVMPYVYVIFWGQNLPFLFWVLFFGWIGLSAYLFWRKLEKEIKNGARNEK